VGCEGGHRCVALVVGFYALGTVLNSNNGSPTSADTDTISGSTSEQAPKPKMYSEAATHQFHSPRTARAALHSV
jgi:hypothetical protein